MTSTPTTVLVLNAGSSSLKYQAVDPATGTASAKGHFDRMEPSDFPQAFVNMTLELEEQGVEPGSLTAVGHRVVHGGPRFRAPTLIDDQVLTDIDALSRLAPLHNPPAADGIRHARATYPDLPQVACSTPRSSAPARGRGDLRDRPESPREQRVRRYGFHGTSHQYVSHLVAAVLGREVGTLNRSCCTWATARRPPPSAAARGRDVDGPHPARGPGDGHPQR